MRETHRLPIDSPHKGPITQKMLPFDDVIMTHISWNVLQNAGVLLFIESKFGHIIKINWNEFEMRIKSAVTHYHSKLSLQWRNNVCDCFSNHRCLDCLLNRLFKRRSKHKKPRKYQSSASLACVRGIHRWPVVSPHKGPVTRKMFDDVIMMHFKVSQLSAYCRRNYIR